MSKGNKIIRFRVTTEMRADIDAAAARSTLNRDLGYTSLSDWIRACVQEKLQHLKRSKIKRKKSASGAIVPMHGSLVSTVREKSADGTTKAEDCSDKYCYIPDEDPF